MANLKSSKKDIKRSRRRQLANTSAKSAIKTYIKKAKNADESGASDAIKKAVKALDKAAGSGVIHKNQAARRKSRLMKSLNASKA